MKNHLFFLLLTSILLYACQSQLPPTLPTLQQAPTESSPTIPPFDLEEYTISQLQAGYKAGTFTIEQIVQQYLNRIDAIDRKGPQLNSIIQINPDALAIAKQLDQEFKAGKNRGPMHGIPVLLKDNIDTQDKMATTAGSRALIGSHPLQDSWVAQSLRASG